MNRKQTDFTPTSFGKSPDTVSGNGNKTRRARRGTKRRFQKHVLEATPLGRQVSHRHFNKRSKTTKPRALSFNDMNFHVNFYLLPHWQAFPTANINHTRSIHSAAAGRRKNAALGAHRGAPGIRSARSHLPTGSAWPHLGSRVPGGTSRHRAHLKPQLQGYSYSSRCRLVYIALQQPKGTAHTAPHTQNRHRAASPALEPLAPQSRRGGGDSEARAASPAITVVAAAPVAPQPQREPGKESGRRLRAPLTMARAGGAV